MANSRGPETLRELASETGATPSTVSEVVKDKDLIVVTIPQKNVRDLPADLFKGVPDHVVVVDTGNYYPRHRDGRIVEIEQGTTESQWVEQRLGRPVIKAFNNTYAEHLHTRGKPKGAPGRVALPVAGDDKRSKQIVLDLVDALGFDAVDAGDLDDSWRQQSGTPVYTSGMDADGVHRALAQATRDRKSEFTATASSPGTYTDPK